MNTLKELYGDSFRNTNVTEILIDIFIKVRNQVEWKREMLRSNIKINNAKTYRSTGTGCPSCGWQHRDENNW
jgi:hypothetical protein